MQTEKRNRYADSIDIVGHHTISGYTSDEVTDISGDVREAVKSCSRKKDRGKDSYKTYLQINPNKLSGTGEQRIIRKFSEFQEILVTILLGCGFDPGNFRISRADLCLDSTDAKAYESYKKLHRLLICCVAEAYSFKNCYRTYNLWTDKSLSVAIKNDEAELENYDKDAESDGESESKNRLELRAKKMSKSTLEHEFLEKWCHRLDTAITRYEDVQQKYNMELERTYKEDLAKDPKDRDYANLTGFLLAHKECIFCRKQMIDLLSRFDEVQNPENRADLFKRCHRIEYFSKKDLQVVVDTIKDKMKVYFQS